MGESMSIKQALQDMISDNMGILRGKVISTSPLKIRAVNDDKLELTTGALCVPRHLTEHTQTVDIPALGIAGAAMVVRSGLRAGDLVYLLSYNQGKKYYVLDREG